MSSQAGDTMRSRWFDGEWQNREDARELQVAIRWGWRMFGLSAWLYVAPEEITIAVCVPFFAVSVHRERGQDVR